MLTLGVPAFLLAGALAMLVPLALHLIRRRPPLRAPLPTARFLVEDPRNAVRVSRPTDLPLLALRMLLLLLLGFALARPAWIPAPEGTSTVVLLDRGAAMRGDGWRAALGEARRSLLAADGAAKGELVMFDTAAVRVPRHRITPALFDSLLAAGPTEGPADYAAALRAIPASARALRGADSVRVRMISALADGGWTPGLAPLRRAAWPGTLDLARVPIAQASTVDSADAGAPPRNALVLAARGGGFASAALGAAGLEGGRGNPQALPGDAAVYLLMEAPSAATAGRLLERARAGATVIVTPAGAAEALRAALPWRGGFAVAENSGGAMWFGPELELAGAAGRVQAGAPADGARTVAAWEDGRPAAVARALGSGCLVFVGTELEGGELPYQAEYPAALARLARGCAADAPNAADVRPLDPGAVAVLRGRGPAALAASAVGASEAGVALGRWVLGAAILIALVETLLAYRRRSAGPRGA